jgi:hypothetical protein
LRTVVLDDLGSQRSLFWYFWSCLKKKWHEGRLLCDCLILPWGKMEEAMFDKASKFRLTCCV